MARSDPQVNIRMPQELKDRLEAATAETKRSLNAEIIARLEGSFERSADAQSFDMAAKVGMLLLEKELSLPQGERVLLNEDFLRALRRPRRLPDSAEMAGQIDRDIDSSWRGAHEDHGPETKRKPRRKQVG